MTPLRRVAVLGAGTMGARIAAHFANAGIPALLLDIVLPNQPKRNAAALSGFSGPLCKFPITSISPLQPAQGQCRRIFSKEIYDSPPSSHLIANSGPIC